MSKTKILKPTPIHKLRELVKTDREKYDIDTEFSYRFDSRSKRLILCYSIPLVVHESGHSRKIMKKREKYFPTITAKNFKRYFGGNSTTLSKHANFVAAEKSKYEERFGDDDEYDFRWWVDKFLSRKYGGRRTVELSEHTLKSNRTHLLPYRDYILSVEPISGEILEHEDKCWLWYEQYYQARLEGKFRGKWTAQTVDTSYRNIQGFYNFVADRHPDGFSYGVLKKARLPIVENERTEINDTEFAKIQSFIKKNMYDSLWSKFVLMLRLQLKTGMREGELCTIRVSNIDKNERSIKVIGKTGARDYYFSQDHDERIWDSIVHQIKRGAKYLFYQTRVQRFPSKIKKNGEVLRKEILISLEDHTTVHYYNKMFRLMREELKLRPIITSHSLRRFFATRLYEQTKDIELVRRILGHTTARMTEKYIGVVNKKGKQNTIDIGV